MKIGMTLKYFAVAGLISTAALLSACGSGAVSNGNGSNSTAGANGSANSGAVETKNAGVSEVKNKDTSPVTIKISDFFAETESSPASSVSEKYIDREMTITGGVLYELSPDSLKVGMGQNPDFGPESSAPQHFVTCKGKVADYTPSIGDSVANWRKAGQAKIFPVKGVFKEASSYNNKHWVILDPCVLIKS